MIHLIRITAIPAPSLGIVLVPVEVKLGVGQGYSELGQWNQRGRRFRRRAGE
jgi:hypothetical protein